MSLNHQQKSTIFGQDPEIIKAAFSNVLSWMVTTLFPRLLPKLLPPCEHEDLHCPEEGRTKCVSIGRPGGMEQLRVIILKPDIMTVGYNLNHFCEPPFTTQICNSSDIPIDCIVLKNEYFSVNYADCTIRWGLYESAKKFVGWPIVPGFDVAGRIEAIPSETDPNDECNKGSFKVGDLVFGCTLFGAYSSRVLVPEIQLRKIPPSITIEQAAALPAVSLTALHALSLAGHFPGQGKYSNKSILIHSAAGGVGSMLIQMSKILGLHPIVGVVGSTSKVKSAKALGCDVVIDKSKEDLWKRASEVVGNGYKTIMDANGVSTLQQSYDHLAPTGRLVIFGFHSNLPMGRDSLNPFEWIKMAKKMGKMPAFDPMSLTVDNKSVMGFNLSFFADEKEVVSELFDQICKWLEAGLLKSPNVAVFDMNNISDAHTLIQSGSSVGKIVVKC